MTQCVVLGVGALPYVHLVFTWRHSHGGCSQAFPVLCQLCIIMNALERGYIQAFNPVTPIVHLW